MRSLLVLVILLGAVARAAGPVAASVPATSTVDLARARELADDTAGAAATLEPYVAAHPDDASAGLLLGDLYVRTGDWRRAETAWKRVLDAHPGDRTAHARLGGLYTAAGRVEDAAREYAADMPSLAAANALVALHVRMGDLGWFENATEDLAERNRFDPAYQLMQANVLQAAHRPAAAIAYFDRVVGLSHGGCDERIARANDEVALHRIGDAIDDLEHCLAADPDAYGALTLRGEIELRREQPEAARGFIERALAVDPDGYEARVARGVLENAAGAWQAAMRDDEAAIAADPLRSEGYANLAGDLLDRAAVSTAESTIRSGLRVAPADGRLHFLLGRAYQLEGKPVPLIRAEYRAALTSDEDVVVRAAHDALGALGPDR
jgi:tetratricopeptide (TPR) repeat protein